MPVVRFESCVEIVCCHNMEVVLWIFTRRTFDGSISMLISLKFSRRPHPRNRSCSWPCIDPISLLMLLSRSAVPKKSVEVSKQSIRARRDLTRVHPKHLPKIPFIANCRGQVQTFPYNSPTPITWHRNGALKKFS